jgi:protoporphyrinogen IX oxidase
VVEWLGDAHAWLKALHIISVIAWMAGLLYLPRLFAYHADSPPGSVQAETFKIMERRLLRAIMNPAMIATYVFGISLVFVPGVVDWSDGWIYVKLVFVTFLTILHHVFSLWRKRFARDGNVRPAKFYKAVNEIPTVLVIGVVVMVVVRPF